MALAQAKPLKYAIGDLILDEGLVSLTRDGQPLHLQGLTFDLLMCLARHAPLVVSKDTIFDDLWPRSHVGEETLKQRVRLLRKALGDDSRSPRYVETVRGRGYRLVCSVVQLDIKETILPADTAMDSLAKSRRWWLVLVPILAILAWWYAKPSPPSSPIALPTGDLSQSTSPADELFQRASTYYHRYLPRDNETAIQLLKQAVALQPSHSQSFALLSRAYSQQPKLGNGYWGDAAKTAADRAIAANPNDPDGYVALGLYYDVSGRTSLAINEYQQALKLKPDHAAAISNTAYGFMTQGRLLESLSWNQRALATGPELQFGKVQMGDTLRLLGFDHLAQAWLEKATTLQPDNLLARVSYSKFLLLDHQYEPALAQISQVASYGWNETLALNSRGDILFFKNDLNAALPFFRKTWQQENSYGGFRLALLLTHLKEDTAVDQVELMLRYFHSKVEHYNETAYLPFVLAALHAVKGNANTALIWFDRAIEAGYVDLRWLSQDPGLAALRAIPDFHQRLESLSSKITAMRKQVNAADLNP